MSQTIFVTQDRHNSPQHIYGLDLSNTDIITLQRATADLYRLLPSSLSSLTFQYRDEEGDLVRMDTTAELVEVMKEKAEAGGTLLLIVGQASDDAAAMSDGDSDSDSFVRVEASDYMSPPSTARSYSDSPITPPSPQAELAARDPESQRPQAAPTQPDDDKAEEAATAPVLPLNPPSAAATAAVQPTVQAVVDSPPQPHDAGEAAASPLVAAEAHQHAEVDEKQPQPEAVRARSASGPPFIIEPPPPILVRRRKGAQTPAFARPLVANINRMLCEAKRVVNCAGQCWMNDVQSVVGPKVTQLRTALSHSMTAVSNAASARPNMVVVAAVLLMLLGGALAASHTMASTNSRAQTGRPFAKRLEARIERIERYGQKLLAEHSDTTDTLFTLGGQLSQSVKRIEALEAQLQQQQRSIDSLQSVLSLYIQEVEQLKTDADSRYAEQTTQQRAHTKAHKGRSWLMEDWPLKEAEPLKQGNSDGKIVRKYEDSVNHWMSAFDSSPQEELQPFNSQQPTEQRQSEIRRASTSSKAPSSALWGEPSRFATSVSSVAWSSPSSAQAYSSVGATYAGSSSSSSSVSASSASSSLFDSERKSARTERAERRERQKRERELTNSIWSFPTLEDDEPYKPATPTSPPAATSTSASAFTTATKSCTSSCSSSRDEPKPSQHKPDRRSGSCTGYKGSGKAHEKSLKQVGKKIGKALQTVNDAAKRVWKAWKSQW